MVTLCFVYHLPFQLALRDDRGFGGRHAELPAARLTVPVSWSGPSRISPRRSARPVGLRVRRQWTDPVFGGPAERVEIDGRVVCS